MEPVQPIRKLNQTGLEQFSKLIEQRRKGEDAKIPFEFCFSDLTTTNIEPEIKIDFTRTFGDRLECAEYIWSLIEAHWQDDWEHDVGLWSWFAALYFDQYAPSYPRKPSRQENYILSAGNWRSNATANVMYRHCTWGPVLTIRMEELKPMSKFIVLGTKGPGRGMDKMGDAVEQTISTPKNMRSESMRNTIKKLYMDTTTGLAKSGFANKPSDTKLKSGKYSNSGSGGIRRLHIVSGRMKLTHNLGILSENEIIDLGGDEFSKSKWNK